MVGKALEQLQFLYSQNILGLMLVHIEGQTCNIYVGMPETIMDFY